MLSETARAAVSAEIERLEPALGEDVRPAVGVRGDGASTGDTLFPAACEDGFDGGVASLGIPPRDGGGTDCAGALLAGGEPLDAFVVPAAELDPVWGVCAAPSVRWSPTDGLSLFAGEFTVDGEPSVDGGIELTPSLPPTLS